LKLVAHALVRLVDLLLQIRVLLRIARKLLVDEIVGVDELEGGYEFCNMFYNRFSGAPALFLSS
jgi:hypothetical protein